MRQHATRTPASDPLRLSARSYLQFCGDDTTVTAAGCIDKVTAKWPKPARFDAPDCKKLPEKTSWSCPEVDTKNLYTPIRINTGLSTLDTGTGTAGADVDTFTNWDRIRCADAGQLFATSLDKKYNPQECARLCSKIKNYHGKFCTHFSRMWINTKIEEHDDNCGRDGDAGADAGGQGWVPKDGSTNYASAGLGAPPTGGSYTYKAQCVFFQSGNKDCCATKAGWSTAIGLDDLAGSADACSGTPADNWKDKMRTWRLETRGYTPSKSWPIERAAGARRRLSDASVRAANATVLEEEWDEFVDEWHELVLPNGSTWWVTG